MSDAKSKTPRTDAVVITPVMGAQPTPHKWDMLAALARELETALAAAQEAMRNALNYIKHVGSNQTMKGLPHPQQWIADQLEAALAAAPVEQEGYVRVPVEPTEAMLTAGTAYDIDDLVSGLGADVEGIYRAMIAAKP